MVELKVINGGKSKGIVVCQDVRLFSAYSVVDGYKGRDGVKLNWVYWARQKPVAPYEALIDGYRNIDQRVRPYFEEHIDELFTEEEIQALGEYVLEATGSNLQVREESLPVTSVFIPMPYKHVPCGQAKGFFSPSSENGCNLPFEARAYFDLRNCPPSLRLESEAKKRGLRYAEEIIRFLGVEKSFDQAQLTAAIEAIHDGFGLYVEQGKTVKERIDERENYLKQTPIVPDKRD